MTTFHDSWSDFVFGSWSNWILLTYNIILDTNQEVKNDEVRQHWVGHLWWPLLRLSDSQTFFLFNSQITRTRNFLRVVYHCRVYVPGLSASHQVCLFGCLDPLTVAPLLSLHLEAYLCAIRTVRSLHPTVSEITAKTFLLGNCVCLSVPVIAWFTSI